MENKEPSKLPLPKNFKDAALSHIPPGILLSMQKQTSIKDTDLDSLHDKVLKHGPALRANPTSIIPNIPKEERLSDQSTPIPVPVAPSLPKQPSTMSYAIEGHVIEVPLDNVGASITLFYTLLAFVWGKDKKIVKILKQFDFKFFDANKKQIYPPLKKNVKK